MWKERIVPVLVVLLAASLVSCSDDDDPTKPNSPWKTLDVTAPRDNVLSNLQLSWNERNIEHYEELLDEGLIFYFSPWDVLNGTVESWDRVAEVAAVTNLFDPNYANPNQEPVQDINLLLAYPEGDDQWTPIEPEDQATYPGETWYQKIVTYNLTVMLPGDFQYVGRNIQTQFTVRAAAADSKQVWKIVIWRDDVGTGLEDLLRTGRRAAVVEQRTWGSVKSLYVE